MNPIRIPTVSVFVFMAAIALAAQTKIPMGINVSDHNYWLEPVFINMMYNAEDWHLKNADWSGGMSSGCPLDSLKADSAGYPLQVPQTIAGYAPQMVESILGWMYPTGRYVVLWDGDGALTFLGATTESSAPGRMVLSRIKGQRTFITITRSNAANHLRNIRILPEAMETTYDPAHPFLPGYLEVVSKFHCLRFMGWQGTNCSTQKFWDKRRKVYEFCQSTSAEKGPSIEMTILLCNEAKADFWYCLPHQADDQYIDSVAVLIKRLLSPSLRVYVEYSNETWNWAGGFCTFGWLNGNNGVGAAVGATDSIKDSLLYLWQHGGNHGSTNGWMAARTFKHFMKYWTGADRPRLIRTVAGQAGWYDITTSAMDVVMARGGCDAVAVAPYFGMSGAVNDSFCSMPARSVTTAMINNAMGGTGEFSVEYQRTHGLLRENGDIAKTYGVKELYYEAGPDMGYSACTFSGGYGDSVHAANYTQGMYDNYVKHIGYSATEGTCSLYIPLILFGTPEHYGHLDSASQYMNLKNTPNQLPAKWRALMDCNSTKRADVTAVRLAPVVSRQAMGPKISNRILCNVSSHAPRTLGQSFAAKSLIEVYNLNGSRILSGSSESVKGAMLAQPRSGIFIIRETRTR